MSKVNESDKLLEEVVLLSICKVMERVGYSITHETWFDRLIIKTLKCLEKYSEMFMVTILKSIKKELEEK